MKHQESKGIRHAAVQHFSLAPAITVQNKK